MSDLSKPEVVLTHESDLDGFVSGLLLKRLARELFGIEVPLQTYHNHNWKQRPMTERCAWVSDLTVDARLDKPGWLIVDHHQHDQAPKAAWLIHDTTKSAGLLCYELCGRHGIRSDALDRLVHLNDVADLFQPESPDFLEAVDYANLVKSYQFWNLYDVIEGDLERLLDHPLLRVMRVKREVEDPIGYDWSRRNILAISPTLGLVNTVVGNSNLIIHRMLEQGAPYPVLMTLLRRGNGMVVASFRSRDGSAIRLAEKLQGGGHPNAAGAVLPRTCQRIPDAILYLKQLFNPQPTRATALNNLESLFESLESPAPRS